MPATMSSCLNSCGDCGSAYQEPGCSRAGHQEVAGALGGRAGQRRRLDLDEVALVQHVAGDLVGLAAQPQRRGRAGAAQVQVAVLEPDLLADLGVLVDRERQRRGLGEHGQLGGGDLDLRRWAGRGSRCRPGRRDDLAGDLHAELVAQPVRARSAISPSRNTTWAEPEASRRSMKITPPWSRRRATHPARVTVCPACSARRVPAAWVRITVRGYPATPGDRPPGSPPAATAAGSTPAPSGARRPGPTRAARAGSAAPRTRSGSGSVARRAPRRPGSRSGATASSEPVPAQQRGHPGGRGRGGTPGRRRRRAGRAARRARPAADARAPARPGTTPACRAAGAARARWRPVAPAAAIRASSASSASAESVSSGSTGATITPHGRPGVGDPAHQLQPGGRRRRARLEAAPAARGRAARSTPRGRTGTSAGGRRAAAAGRG